MGERVGTATSRNLNLNAATVAKKDEFYTPIEIIAAELEHYERQFEGKVVYCNCDNPFESNFFKFFARNFNRLGLKKLMATCYVDRQPSLFDLSHDEGAHNQPYKIEVSCVDDVTGDGAFDLSDVEYLIRNAENVLTELEGNGDFRSDECKDLMAEADIVCTNPPFSLFREYVAQVMDMGKKFLILGNINAVTYKDVFPLLMQDRMWLGPSIHSGDRDFYVPDNYPLNAAGCGVDAKGRRFIRVKGVRWFTNLGENHSTERLDLPKAYDSSAYPRYDNYDAIEVSKVADIPCDYDGVMGVPITFIDKYNPSQFEIVGIAKRGAGDPALKSRVYTRDEYPNYSDMNAAPTLWVDGVLRNTYPRILIRNRHPECHS